MAIANRFVFFYAQFIIVCKIMDKIQMERRAKWQDFEKVK